MCPNLDDIKNEPLIHNFTANIDRVTAYIQMQTGSNDRQNIFSSQDRILNFIVL